MPHQTAPIAQTEFLIYQTKEGQTHIEARLENETIWLNQKQLSQLFQTTTPNINMHIKNILNEGELDHNSVIKLFLTTASDHKEYQTKYYNLDMIISLGYRVKSAIATHFRIWATHGKTAAEIIYERADATKPNMGMTTWLGDAMRLNETEIAKNYLTQHELDVLNRIVSMYLEFAELQALERKSMHMKDWIVKLDDFLKLSGKTLLHHAGSISHEQALQKAHGEYDKYYQAILSGPSEVEMHFLQLEQKIKKIPESSS